jgi:hypothetical protein
MENPPHDGFTAYANFDVRPPNNPHQNAFKISGQSNIGPTAMVGIDIS